MNNKPWSAIFDKYKIHKHDFRKGSFVISAKQIKIATSRFMKTNEREVRILCKQDSREDRPKVFRENSLFLLPIRNGIYAIVKGEGYVDLKPISGKSEIYSSRLDFDLDTAKVGNSEMQHLDFAYASSLIRTFLGDETLVLTIRGRKYTPRFTFRVGSQTIEVDGVQTEVDAGYEGKNQIALVEAKNNDATNVIIRQLFYPLRQWSHHTKKKVVTLFFQKRAGEFLLWHYGFADEDDYNSIRLVKSRRYQIL